jgi:hypothetical protein
MLTVINTSEDVTIPSRTAVVVHALAARSARKGT